MDKKREAELLNYELSMARSMLILVGMRTSGYMGAMINDYFKESAKRIEAGRKELHGDVG